MIDTVIFDFDGTLADTTELVYQSWVYTFQRLRGEVPSREEIYKTFGETLAYSMNKYFGEEEVDEALTIYRDYQRRREDEAWLLFPGIRDMMSGLKARGIQSAVVTSRTRSSTLQGLTAFGMVEAFVDIVSCDDTSKPKPDAEPCLIALEKMGSTSKEAIFVGDTSFDIGCAHNAGVQAVFVSWSVSPNKPGEVGLFAPDFVIDAPMELLALLDRINRD